MPAVKILVSIPEAAEEVFEDDSDDSLSSYLDAASNQLSWWCGHPSMSSLVQTFQDCRMMSSLSSLPSYQAVVLLTEYHLIRGDTGPLPHHLKTFLTIQDISGNFLKTEKSKSSDYETKNLKHFEKYVALKRVNRIMAKRPWAVNKYIIEDLRLANLSLSEIVHALLILAHNQALLGISARLQTPQNKKNQSFSSQETVNKNIERVKNNENDYEKTHSRESSWFQDCISLSDDRLYGINCERYWDDFGFSILNCLSEKASHVLDNRFSCLQDLRKGNKNSSRTLEAVWRYSQQLLGFGLDDYDTELIEETLDDYQKDLIYSACMNSSYAARDTDCKQRNACLPLLTLVTVQEARMQAQVIYVLHAVKQFMNW